MNTVITMFFSSITWLILGFLSLGPAGFIFCLMRRAAKYSWPTKVDTNYKPRISVLVPTYNELDIIQFKLVNLSHVRYPDNLMEIIIVDSNSCDGTREIVRQFLKRVPQVSMRMLVETERRGKSHALNYALSHCEGDVIVVSDADCFWPPDILEKSLPFLGDPTVGAISGPKRLLNSNESWVTRSEEAYLRSANFLRLGESKAGSTVFFEGGFSAFKREAFCRFDPYDTGSDDCGTVISVMEKNFRAMLVPEAEFFSTFPESFRGKIDIKLRRANQLVRVFGNYLDLLSKRKIKTSVNTILPNIFMYLFSPIFFMFFIVVTVGLLVEFPFLLLASLFLILPSVRFYFYAILESNLLLTASLFAVLFGKKFSMWSQPPDRTSITKEKLVDFNLI